MTGAVPVSRRSLFADRRRAVLSTIGVAVSMMLVLVLGGVLAGAMHRVTAYIDQSPADVIVSQRGVRTMHMSSSALEASIVDSVRDLDGVAWAEGLGYSLAVVRARDSRELAYLYGYDTSTGRGGPRRIIAGGHPKPGEAIIDTIAADNLGVQVGDRVEILGRSFRLSGLSEGGTSIVNTSAFIGIGDFTSLLPRGMSYVLVGGRPGADSGTLAARIEAAVPDVTAQTREGFSRSEARIVSDMSADIMRIMTVIGLLIALSIVGLTLFTVTLSRMRDYAVARALGARTSRLTRVVLAQAGWLVGLGLVLAVGLAVALGEIAGALSPRIAIAIEPVAVTRSALAALGVGVAGAIIPLRRVTRVDPASVFRREL